MALSNLAVEVSCTPSEVTSLNLFQGQSESSSNDIRPLIRDFFCWFEEEWKQLVIQTSGPNRDDLFSQVLFLRSLDEEKRYSAADLASLVGYFPKSVSFSLNKAGIRPVKMRSGFHGGGSSPNLYLGKNCKELVEKWRCENLCAAIDHLWARYVPEPCGQCRKCLTLNRASRFFCSSNQTYVIRNYRESFHRFLRALQRYENIDSWWEHERNGIIDRHPGSMASHSGIVLFYLLDRHLLDLSLVDLLALHFPDLEYKDFIRPWSNRHPEEYKSYIKSLERVGKGTRMEVHAIVSLILMKYGLQTITDLGRHLSSEEIRQAVNDGRLLVPHICYDMHLDLPLSQDIRAGHVALDELRYYFWSYASDRIRASQKDETAAYWNKGPRTLKVSSILILEHMLTAKIWPGDQAILPLRLETEKSLKNPYITRLKSEAESAALHKLPESFQNILATYINYSYYEQNKSLETLANILQKVIPFLCWVHDRTQLNDFAQWDQIKVQTIVGAFLATRYPHIKTNYKNLVISSLYGFFHTLAQIDLPHPPGYHAIRTLRPSRSTIQRPIPVEEVIDRVFVDGVCTLDYDPFARLALTIQYYCGTRVTETCELPLFCFLDSTEDGDSRVFFLMIPLGKTKEERRFPIASVGMGPLLEYMAQVVGMQLAPDGGEIPIHAPRTNARYLETDPEKAFHWDYLFDRRCHPLERPGSHPNVLGPMRVGKALKEALLFAAKKNPEGLFLEETYSRRCNRKRSIGQRCDYLTLVDGITLCPICGGSLPGKRGHRCQRKLKQAFECDGVGREGDYFCPKCDGPLAEVVPITTHTFRHNSVTRAHRYGMPLAQNMMLHGHKTIPMHLAYLHLLSKDQQDAIVRVFSAKFLQDVQSSSGFAPGQMIVEGIAQTASYEQLLALTLRQGLTRGTDGLWGGFWTGALAEEGVVSPIRRKAQIVLTEETFHHAVAQYRFEALGLAVSEVALERGTKRKFRATVASFLERHEIERVVSTHLLYIQQGYLNTVRGVRLLEADIQAKRRFLEELAEMLHPWVERYGLESIDQLVMELDPGTDVFQKQRGTDAFDQEFPTAESES
jgi:site-specific recombinase XerD